MAYAAAGLPVATFHGDEAMQLYMSSDYAAAFIYHDFDTLTAGPPYFIDSPPQLRLLNGSINRYTIGLSWHLAGMTTGDLPPSPGWDWGLDYDTNVATGHRPPEKLLHIGRISSTLFLALSIPVMFGIGWQFGGRAPAYLTSGLYALNPAILLNGRRAMQEGAMLFFGLLTVLIAIHISRRNERRAGARWWLALAAAAGLALAGKHTTVIFVAGGFAWIFLAQLARREWRALGATTAKLAVSGLLALAVFIALSPALWRAPLERLQNLIDVRRELIAIQIGLDSGAPMSFTARVGHIVTQPFIAPPAHFEVPSWGEFTAVSAEIERYTASPWRGLHFGALLGVPLTLLAALGIVASLWPRLHAERSLSRTVGVLGWLGSNVVALLTNPIPWQRYYLPLIPVSALLAGYGLFVLADFAVRWHGGARRAPPPVHGRP